jgi:hypothetical protein
MFFVEPTHPWIAVHTQCIAQLPWSLRRTLGEIKEHSQSSPEDEVLLELLNVRGFLEAIEKWCIHVKASRKIYDELFRQRWEDLGVLPPEEPKRRLRRQPPRRA